MAATLKALALHNEIGRPYRFTSQCSRISTLPFTLCAPVSVQSLPLLLIITATHLWQQTGLHGTKETKQRKVKILPTFVASTAAGRTHTLRLCGCKFLPMQAECSRDWASQKLIDVGLRRRDGVTLLIFDFLI